MKFFENIKDHREEAELALYQAAVYYQMILTQLVDNSDQAAQFIAGISELPDQKAAMTMSSATVDAWQEFLESDE